MLKHLSFLFILVDIAFIKKKITYKQLLSEDRSAFLIVDQLTSASVLGVSLSFEGDIGRCCSMVALGQ